jgi:hypothetical protein
MAWTETRLKKFQATMAAKNNAKKNKKAKKAKKTNGGVQVIPLDLIPERIKKTTAPKMRGIQEADMRRQLAMATLQVLHKILDS